MGTLEEGVPCQHAGSLSRTAEVAPFSFGWAPAEPPGCARRTAGGGCPHMRVAALRISGAVFDPDWCANKAEGFADLVFQEALVGEVEFDGAVGEEDEGGRGNRRLRHVENLHAR